MEKKPILRHWKQLALLFLCAVCLLTPGCSVADDLPPANTKLPMSEDQRDADGDTIINEEPPIEVAPTVGSNPEQTSGAPEVQPSNPQMKEREAGTMFLASL